MSARKFSLNPLQEEMLPKEWDFLPIGKVLTDSQYGTNAPSVANGGTAVVGMKDLQNGRVLTNSLAHADLDDTERSKYLLKNGDILINRTNSYDLVGKVGIYDSEVEAVFASYLVRLHVKKSKIYPGYLNYWLNGYFAQKTIKRIATRAISQANVNPTELKKHCFVPLPHLDEQRSIASILSTWDEAIQNTERLIWMKKRQLRGWMQKHISQKCNSWPNIRPDELFDTISEKNFPDEELLSVTQDRGVVPRRLLEGRVMSPEGSTAGYKLIRKGDFAISLRSFQGGIEYSNYQGIISPAYTVLRPKVELNSDYFRLFFKSYIFIEKYLNLAVIGIRDGKQISIPDFKSIKIPVPPMREQHQIAEGLSIAQKEIDLLKQLTEKYREQKRGLMQKLLTGQWRVKQGEAA